MKAIIIITPKKAVLDPEAEATRQALRHMGHEAVRGLTLGKYLELELEGDRETAERTVREAADSLLTNPVIEEYRIEFVDE